MILTRARAAIIMFLVLSVLLLGAGSSGSEEKKDSPGVPQPGTLKIVSPREAYDLIQRNKSNTSFVVLDVRTPDEFGAGHIEGATNIDYYHPGFQVELNKLDKGKTYLVYCRTGSRSGHAFQIMKEQQFREVFDMDGGITAWIKEGLPVVK